MNCPVCETPMARVFDAVVLGRHPATYHRCTSCGLIQPANPDWLEEAYSSAIADTDVGLVSRNLRNRDVLGPVFQLLHPPDAKILDVGGGYGLLCRMLRDRGWDCFTTDAYCQNLFAGPFEPGEGFKAHTLLAFEVFEHIGNPLEFVREQIDRYDPQVFVFSTLTHPWEVPPRDWWYYAFETGQHISLYTQASLVRLAERIGWHYTPVSDEIHLFTRQPVAPLERWLLNKRNRFVFYGCRLFSAWKRRGASRLAADYQAIKERVKRSHATGSGTPT